MKYSKPLKDIIAELQKIEDANPGIGCTLNDNEHGAFPPMTHIAPVYVNDSNHVIIIDDFTLNHKTKIVKDYNAQTAQEMWDSYGLNKGSWKNFEEFKKAFQFIKESAEKDLKDFSTAVPMVILSVQL